MRNLFTALKQDTQPSHTALENTFPFSIYHQNNLFNKTAYYAVLSIMKEFHKSSAQVVKQAEHADTRLAQIALMIDSNAVLTALDKDTLELEKDSHLFSAKQGSTYIDTHHKKTDSVRFCATINDEASKDTHTESQLLPLFHSPTTGAIAAAYVWLGSSMGANIIARRLSGMEYDIPTHYYCAMAECAKSWVSFKQHVDALLPELAPQNERVIDDIVEDAKAWFEYLIKLGMQFHATASMKDISSERCENPLST